MKKYEKTERVKLEEEARIDARLEEARESLKKDGGIPIDEAFAEVIAASRQQKN